MIHDVHSWKGKNTKCMEASTEDRFSEAFDELIEDQGEGAFMIEESQNRWKITGYTLPRKGKMFKEEELRNVMNFLILSFHAFYSRFTHYFNCFTSISFTLTRAAPRRLRSSTDSIVFIIYRQLVGDTTTSSQPCCIHPFIYKSLFKP